MPNFEAVIINKDERERTIHQLKVKVNRQVDKIEELNEEIIKKDEEIRYLQEVNRSLSEGAAVQNYIADDNEMLKVIKDISFVVTRLTKDNAFIAYKNYSKNSLRYCKVEKVIFDSYMDNYVSMERKAFLNKCVEIGFIKSNESGKFVFNDNQMRIYFLNKAMVTLISGEKN